MNTIINYAVGIICIILMLLATVYLNRWDNNIKQTKCNNLGGAYIINTSDSNKSLCVLKSK